MAARPARELQALREERADFQGALERLTELRARHAALSLHLHALQGEATACANAAAAAEAPPPRAPHAARAGAAGALHAALAVAERALGEGQREFAGLEQQLHAAERDAVEREARIAGALAGAPAAEAAVEAQAERAGVVARARVELEVSAAGALGRSVAGARGSAAGAALAAAAAAEAGLARTREVRAGAAAVEAQQAALRGTLQAQGAELRASALEQRLDAVLSLKASLGAVAEGLAEGNERTRGARARAEGERSAEYAQLLAQGLNPYEVWRARERDARAAAALARHEAEVERDTLAAVERVLADDAHARGAELEATRRREELDDVRRRSQRGVAEAHTAAYLMARSVGGRDTLDATGRAAARGQLYPSQASLIRPPAWGTGRAAAGGRLDVLALEASRPGMEGTGVQRAWLPAVEEEAAAGEAGEAGSGSARRAEGAAGTGAAGAGAGAGTGTRVVGVGPKGKHVYALRPLSLLEQRLQAGALARQRASITAPQVAAGVAFHSEGFLSSPPALHFRDFVPGVPFVIGASLTNSSLSFNAFRFVELPAALRDLFVVAHTPPGRMSAGLSCPYSVTFLPRANEDIEAELVVLARTGEVRLPLRASTHKALPVCAHPVVDVGAVILGESDRVHLELENAGALPVRVTLARRLPGGAPRAAAAAAAAAGRGAGSSARGGGGGGGGGGEGEGKGSGKEEEGSESGEGEGQAPPALAAAEAAAAEAEAAAAAAAAAAEEEEEALAHEEAALADPNADAFSFPAEATLEAYGTLRIPVTFSPAAVGECALPLLLSFTVLPPAAFPAPPVGGSSSSGSGSGSGSGVRGVAPWDAARVAGAALTPPPLQCLVRGRGFPPPLYLEADTLDFRVCACDRLYRGVVTVRNRGSVVGPVSVRLPPALARAGVVSIHPASGYVQAPLGAGASGGAGGAAAPADSHGAFSFQVHFRPSEAFLAAPGAHGAVATARWPVGDEGGADREALARAPALTIPLEVVSPIQALPLPFALEARVTSARLRLSPPSEGLRFGESPVGQAATLPLTLTNDSALPQKYGFVGLPEGFAVSPGAGEGIGVLLPGESVALRAVFLPARAGRHAGALRCRTSLGATYDVPVEGEGVAPPLALSASALLLAATALGEEELATTLLTNTSSAALDFDVGAPCSAEEGGAGGGGLLLPPLLPGLPAAAQPLTIHPATGTLAPGASVRLAVRFAPSRDYFEAALARGGQARVQVKRAALEAMESLGSASGGSGGGGSGEEVAPLTAEGSWLAPIFWRRHEEYSVLRPEPRSEAGAEAAPPPPLQRALVLHVLTCALPSALSAAPTAHSFGAVPVGHSAEAVVTLTNSSLVPLDLAPEPLPPHCGFTLLTPPPCLPPGASAPLRLAFNPTAHRIYVASWRIGAVGEAPRVAVALTGVGIAPSLAVAPPGASAMDFGAVLLGDAASRTFDLFNPTPFPMPFAIEGPLAHFPAPPALYAPTALPTFAVSPAEGTVPGGGGAVRVTVTFFPRRAHPAARPTAALFLLNVPHQPPEAVRHIYCIGRGAERALAVAPPLPLPPAGASGGGATLSAGIEARVLAALAAARAGSCRVAAEDISPEEDPGSPSAAQEDVYLLTFSAADSGSGRGGRRGARFEGLPQAQAQAQPAPVSRELLLTCLSRGAAGVVVGGGEGVGLPAAPPLPPAGAPPPPPATFAATLPAALPGAPGAPPRPHGFSLSPATGTLAPGEALPLVFTFTPAPARAERGAGGLLLQRPGEWQEVRASIALRGGVAVPGAAEERTVTVILRGFMPGAEGE